MFGVVTTFSDAGLELYGNRMLETFAEFWPKNVTLYAYYDTVKPKLQADNIVYIPFTELCPDHYKFVDRHKNNQRIIDDHNVTPKLRFKWQAIRFSYKAFVQEAHGLQFKDRYMIWCDADTFTHTPITEEWLRDLTRENCYLSILGRQKQYTETGWVMFDTVHPYHPEFLHRYINYYLTDEFLKLDEWHDCWILDTVIGQMTSESKINVHNLTPECVSGHPFLTGILGTRMDHLKGPDRKIQGTSKKC